MLAIDAVPDQKHHKYKHEVNEHEKSVVKHEKWYQLGIRYIGNGLPARIYSARPLRFLDFENIKYADDEAFHPVEKHDRELVPSAV